MPNRPWLTIVIPAFEASRTLDQTLRSIFDVETGGRPEVLVVDDGSSDGGTLQNVTGLFDDVTVLRHETNRGMCAARNTGIRASRGEFLMILDADDELVPGWPQALRDVLAGWPESAGVCFSACRNPQGQSTVSRPDYQGPITKLDLLEERYAGEYLPLFRGDYIRGRGYVDLKTRKSCGILSYLSMASDGPIWATRRVLRIYRDRNQGSVTATWAEPARARETAQCYAALFQRFGSAYESMAPRAYRKARLRHAVYLQLAEEPGAFSVWRDAASMAEFLESAGSLSILCLGKRFARPAVSLAKRLGLVKRYG